MGGRSGKFGVVVLKASMLDWGLIGRVDLPVCAKFGVAVLKASMLELGGTPVKFGVAVLKASASRSDKFDVVIFKECILEWWDRSASTSNKFHVAVF